MFLRRPALSFCVLLAGAPATLVALRWLHPVAAEDALSADGLPSPRSDPRAADAGAYRFCLGSPADDPSGALAMADAWPAADHGETASQCQGLAKIALGWPEAGAAVLEDLARRSSASPGVRASMLSQATQARLMAGQPEQALADVTAALDLSPSDPDLLMMRATGHSALGNDQEAINDLNEALRIGGERSDVLVSRAALWRKLGDLQSARADIERALARDPEDPDALLERGILRQRTGDRRGAQADWEHARNIDPNSTIADLAQQNLSLLQAGPGEP